MSRSSLYLTILIAVFNVLPNVYGSQQVEITIHPWSTEIVPGEPLLLDINLKNSSTQQIHLSSSCGDDLIGNIVDSKECKRVIHILTPEGKSLSAGWDLSAFPLSPIPPNSAMKYRNRIDTLFLLREIGEYKLWAEYQHPGRVYDQIALAGENRGFKEYWKGGVTSNIVSITVNQPSGADLIAYQDLFLSYIPKDPQEPFTVSNIDLGFFEKALEKYPSSTYAAWALWFAGDSQFASHVSAVRSSEDIDFAKRVATDNVDCPTCVKAWQDQLRTIVQPWQELYLHFPNFPLRNELLYKLSRVYVRMGLPQKALELLDQVNANPGESEIASQARKYKTMINSTSQ